jgi:hypothetical protein
MKLAAAFERSGSSSLLETKKSKRLDDRIGVNNLDKCVFVEVNLGLDLRANTSKIFERQKSKSPL